MFKKALGSSVGVYKHLVGDIVILAFAVLGGLVANYLDPLRISGRLDPTLAYGVYTLACLALSFPIVFTVMLVLSAANARATSRPGGRLDIEGLRLAEGMLKDGTWYESQEHSITIINDTGHDLKQCYIMLDEVAWTNFEGEWQVMSGDVYSEPFSWNKVGGADRKIDIDHGDRASFALIAHNEYPIRIASAKRNEIKTDFYFVFYGAQYSQIGFGPDIRLRISIRGKDEVGRSFPPILYLLYVKLLQPHGIPKVDVVGFERL